KICSVRYLLLWVFFFFQAEDGIRDRNVTGVQTCALPISAISVSPASFRATRRCKADHAISVETEKPSSPRRCANSATTLDSRVRSEERRVGKEWRTRWSESEEKEKR